MAEAAASTATDAPEDILLPASGLPPIPAHLVQSIKAGKFVDFGELLPEALREAVFETVSGQKEDKKKKKQFVISSPADWGLAFAIYMAVTVHFKPDRAYHLAVYASIIMGLARDNRSPLVWSRYDRLFRQAAAVNPALDWHRRELDLWLMASYETPNPYQVSSSAQQPFRPSSAPQSSQSEEPCRRFNRGTCPFIEAQCKYKHICQRCLAAGHVARDCPRLQVPSRRPPPSDTAGQQ